MKTILVAIACIVGVIIIAKVSYDFWQWFLRSIEEFQQKQAEAKKQRLAKIQQEEELKRQQALALRAKQEEQEREFTERMLSYDVSAIAKQSGATVEEVDRELGYPSIWQKLFTSKDNLQVLLECVSENHRMFFDVEESPFWRGSKKNPMFSEYLEKLLHEISPSLSWKSISEVYPTRLIRSNTPEWFQQKCIELALEARGLSFLVDMNVPEKQVNSIVQEWIQAAGQDFDKLTNVLWGIPSCNRGRFDDAAGGYKTCTCGASHSVYQAMTPLIEKMLTSNDDPNVVARIRIPSLNEFDGREDAAAQNMRWAIKRRETALRADLKKDAIHKAIDAQ